MREGLYLCANLFAQLFFKLFTRFKKYLSKEIKKNT